MPDVPSITVRETLDVCDLPPEPLKMTLETVADLDDDGVVAQVSDRVPQHLFPRLDGRGFAYDTVERDDRAVAAIWRAWPARGRPAVARRSVDFYRLDAICRR